MKHTISALVDNKAGVLARISGLFARRGFNIDSLAVGTSGDPEVSRVCIIVDGDDYVAEQVTRQLDKLINVRKVKVLDEKSLTSRELVLVKVNVGVSKRSEIIDIARIMSADIVDISHDTLTLEFSGKTEKVDQLIDLLSKYDILEVTRTGTIALQKGQATIHDPYE
ncbi:MAG: acetolactate synthase small subunit [Clostridiales Family XIII bacterium]|nr:acetolactate synthase small subunit [Clostridiales Family XIII bacterium]